MGLYEDNYEVTETQPTSESPGPADAEMGREVLFKDIMQGTSALRPVPLDIAVDL